MMVRGERRGEGKVKVIVRLELGKRKRSFVDRGANETKERKESGGKHHFADYHIGTKSEQNKVCDINMCILVQRRQRN